MCGLCGILTIDGRKPNKPLINQMNEAQRHRGPDGEGIYTYHDGPIALSLAHRRLSIIDLSPAGLQPMSNEDGKIHLVVNGEIYNFIDETAPRENGTPFLFPVRCGSDRPPL